MASSSGTVAGWGRLEHALFLFFCSLGVLLGLGGCSRFRPKPTVQYVYVSVKQTYLRDRVAAVSERTGTVENGQRLQVLDHGRRFYRVKTATGQVGWIEERAVATEEVYDQFSQLAAEHRNDPAIAQATVDDDANLHIRPGRETDHFYRLSEGDKLQMLHRATLPRPLPPGTTIAVKRSSKRAGEEQGSEPPPIPMEDWWLVRDQSGRVGWLLSRALNVDVPDSIGRYAENQRFVGMYVLQTVHDDAVEGNNKEVPEYVTVLSPYAAGLPYDFNQVRVFIWNTKMHRYETAFRDRDIYGYLPVTVGTGKDPYGKSVLAQTEEPMFRYQVLAADAPQPVPDPKTGEITPGRLIEKTYRLESNIVRRVEAPGSPKDDEAHPVPEVKKERPVRHRR